MKVKELVEKLETIYPLAWQESWDHSGLSIGNEDAEVEGIYLCLDVTAEGIVEAQLAGCNVLIAHHPYLFSAPQTITADTVRGRSIRQLIQKDLAVYCLHTNLDKAPGGMNDRFMELLKLTPFDPLIKGEGPSIGRIAKVTPRSLSQLLDDLKEVYQPDCLRYVGDPQTMVGTIASVNGSGADFAKIAKDVGADVLITGDVKYHEFMDAKESELCLIDVGHFASEDRIFKELLDHALTTISKDLKVVKGSVQKDHPVYRD